MIKNSKISTKLLLMVVPAIIVMLGLVVVLYKTTYMTYDASKDIYYDSLYITEYHLLNADRDYYQAELAKNRAIDAKEEGNTADYESFLADYNANLEEVRLHLSGAESNLKKDQDLYSGYTSNSLIADLDQKGITLDEELDRTITESDLTFQQLLENFDKNFTDWYSVYDLANSTGDYELSNTKFSEARADLKIMQDLLIGYSELSSHDLEKSLNVKVICIIIIVLISIVLITALAIYLLVYIRKGILTITEDMNILAKKDLSSQFSIVDSKDEFGLLSVASNKVLLALREIVSKLNSTTEVLNNSTDKMNHSTTDATGAVNQIAHSVNEISQTVSSQATDTEQASIEIMSLEKVVEQSGENAKNLAEASGEIKSTSQEGMDIVNDLYNITQQNQAAFDIIFEIINSINQSAAQIGEASGLIAGIATQTNLLSLNASIEAARAGEAGKGFAVVADQIRQLAEQSSNSVKVIDEMLQDLQSGISKAGEQSKTVRQVVKKQTDSVNMTKDKYITIVSTIDIINSEIISLDEISRQMETSCNHVVEIISNLSASAEENAATTEVTAESTHQILNTMTAISEASNMVNVHAKDLHEIISEFNL